ncbi:hypothetical protein Acj9p037 [Acinetobacter phage Acj9]|uniref:Conserved hypothetical phage protein n=1 Tax=Acinetobacter phage Acj9 TaxID=760939 RepID=E5EPH1_9CAUD|nr:hypothetical protein Acj9p037 [Acinetobacter phage Acj9]ADG59937.1 conserved hypothetical phage protein [Acinetobacter phage Acj9]
MKLQRENNQSAEYSNLRGKSIFRIVGTEDQADLIERLDAAIGSEIKCYGFKNGEQVPLTWKQESCDDCADYVWGTGCGWVMDHDEVEEFKTLWKKYKKLVK